MLIHVTDLPKKKRIQSDKKTPGLNVYLGKGAERTDRLARLAALATQRNLTISELIQQIADGTIKLCK